jgi:hypothetical protein
MTMAGVARRILIVPAAALALAACGAPPPQAPPKQAMKLSVATSGISTACGLAYQATAFPGTGNQAADLETLEASASSSATKLASVYRGNPAWIYQGDTVSEIVGDAVAMLRACGLGRAAGMLSAAASGRGSGTGRTRAYLLK